MLHQLDEFLPFGKSVPLDDLLAVALLVFFGVRTLQVPNALIQLIRVLVYALRMRL